MSRIREYFDLDCKLMCSMSKWRVNAEGEDEFYVDVKAAYDFLACAKYLYFFLPDVSDINQLVISVIENPQTLLGETGPQENDVLIRFEPQPGMEATTKKDLKFTGRVHIYADGLIHDSHRKQLKAFAQGKGLDIKIMDRSDAKKRAAHETPLAFISHDSRDKDEFVRPLVKEFATFPAFPIWYDEYSLKIGDSLRASIENGLKNTQKCILVLSPNFLTNEGWGRKEFDSVFTRELLKRESVILPIWHDVTADDVYEYSPSLADKVGIPSTLGPKEVARRIYLQLNPLPR